jgi:RNA polymerase sigma factor (sigma-70 family)
MNPSFHVAVSPGNLGWCSLIDDVPARTTPEEPRTIAARIRDGDPSAEDEVVRAYGARVLVMLTARIGDADAARDLCQDVMIALVRALRDGQLRDTDRLSAFVHGIARNTANNFLRTRYRRPSLTELPESLAADDAPDPAEGTERRQFVTQALASVGTTDRAIIRLTLIDGLKPGEIAARLGLTGAVVRARKSRALRKVVEYVKGLSRS